MHAMQVCREGKKKYRYHENTPTQSRNNAENMTVDFLVTHRSFGMYSRDWASSILEKNKNREKAQKCIIV